MCLGGAWTDCYILEYPKGELNQRFQQVLRGEYGQKKIYQGRELLGFPFALHVKGGE